MQTFLNILPLLACPLMMLLCMGGLFKGNKDCHPKADPNILSEKIDLLVQQNQVLQRELIELKNHKHAG